MTSTMPLDEFIETSAVSLFGYAIVNPFGPTFMGFSLCATYDDTLELVFFSLNPFAQSVERISAYRRVSKGVGLDRLLSQFPVFADIRNFMIDGRAAGRESGTPTIFLDTFADNPAFWPTERHDTAKTIILLSSDPQMTLLRLIRFPLDVMKRVSDEMREAGAAHGSGREDRAKATDADADRILEIISSEKHLKQELKGFIYGWNGAIEFQRRSGSGALANDALQTVEAIQVMIALFPSVAELLGIPKSVGS